MRNRLFVFILAIMVTLVLASIMFAQNAPRPAAKTPDFSGLWGPAGGGPGGGGQQVSVYQGGTGPRQLTRRQRVLQDKNIPFTDWGRESFMYYTAADGEYNGETGGLGDPRYHGGTCGGPKSPSDLGANMQIYQVPDVLVLTYMTQQPWIRKVWIGREHPKDITDYVPFWMGHSVGKWEGDTLVVDTVRIKEGTLLETNRALPQSGNLHMIERFHFDANGNLKIDRTFEDVVAYSKPWSDSRTLRKETNAKQMYTDWDIEENHSVCEGGRYWSENDPWFDNYDKIQSQITPDVERLKKGPPPVPEQYKQK